MTDTRTYRRLAVSVSMLASAAAMVAAAPAMASPASSHFFAPTVTAEAPADAGATLVLAAAMPEGPATNDLAMQQDFGVPSLPGPGDNPDLRLTEPVRGQTGLGSSEESTPPSVVALPRVAPRRQVIPSAKAIAYQRNRLNGYWSVGKFR